MKALKVLIALAVLLPGTISANNAKWKYERRVDEFTKNVVHKAVSPYVANVDTKGFRVVVSCIEHQKWNRKRERRLHVSMNFGFLNQVHDRKVPWTNSAGERGEIGFYYSNDRKSLHPYYIQSKRQQRRWAAAFMDNEWTKYRFTFAYIGRVEIRLPLDGAEDAIEKVAEDCGFDLKRKKNRK